jgi:hypothetical protein
MDNHFDSRVVQAFLDRLEDALIIRDSFQDETPHAAHLVD